MATIRITPEELESAAEFLLQKQEAIISEVDAIRTKVAEVSEGWEGAARSTFISIFEGEIMPILQDKFPEVISGISNQLDTTAKTMRMADDEIAQKMSAQ